MSSRKFLFLQGPATPFFKRLAVAIRQQGHQTLRVNFCGGDQLFSDSSCNIAFKKPFAEWLQWLEDLHQQHHFTDVVLFGDTRPLHQQAINFFKKQNVAIHVYEEGYLRPDWITLEQNGVNGNSNLLNQPIEFWHSYKDSKPTQTESIGKNFLIRAWHDIKYRLANSLCKPVYPHYQTHRPSNAIWEYLGWAIRIPKNNLWREHKDNWTIRRLLSSRSSYFIVPLQLNADSQIKIHSPFDDVQQFIEQVMSSFAQYAPKDSKLVIKNHPLDTGLARHERFVKQFAKSLGIHKRIIFLETGHLPSLLKHTKGTIVVNSTTATSALGHGSPTIALGAALFNLPNLAFQHGLDRFWAEGKPADKVLFSNFRSGLIDLTQINGDFYKKHGIELAVEGSLKKLNIKPILTINSEHEVIDNISTTEVIDIPVYRYKHA